MTKRLLILLAVAIAVAGTALAQTETTPTGVAGPPQPGRGWTSSPSAILWDNGDTDGSNGYSHCDPGCFGFRRELMDDFVVPAGEAWNVDGFSWLQLWNSAPPGSGFGFDLEIVEDSGAAPNGPSVAVANPTGYGEVATGRIWFGRLEAEATAGFDPIAVPEGTYWVEFNVIGPENGFAMIRATVTGSELWTDYEDLPPRGPGSAQFGVPADLSFILTGEIGGPVPTMPLWAMLGLGLALFATAMWWLRRSQEA